jgi:glycyl-tRNA synthetase beta chain
MPELLLELLSEEIPARMQRRAIEDLKRHLDEWLQAHRIPALEIIGYVTPRRLAVIADGIPEGLPPQQEERRGPRKGAPQAAIDGFLRSSGIAAIEDCELRDTGRGEFYFSIIKRPGRASAEVLPDLIYSAIMDVAWPKSMRWPATTLRWVRPLTSIVCVWNGEVLPLPIDGIAVGRTSRGHRFLSPGEFCAGSAAEYLAKLQHAHVILDQDRRRELIRADLDRRAAELGVAVKPDPTLLDEVTGLAEFPVMMAGAIDPDFMRLPPEVLTAAMRTHQKYFACVNPDGSAAPHFLFVADNRAEDGGAAIVAGNERVLRARLADARFFWDQDRRIRLEDRVAALKDRVYHDKLGDLLFKAERIATLAEFLSDYARANSDHAHRAAWLAKADLSTGMVGEFPELQGIIGGYYARHDEENDAVAQAIAEHYKPLGPHDSCPTAPESIAVALADKIDTLVGFFGINEKPSGSRDPFALRRSALGLIRLILENRLRLPLAETFRHSFATWQEDHGLIEWPKSGSPRFTRLGPFGIVDPGDDLLRFIIERLRVYLHEQGFRYDLIGAALAPAGEREDDLARLHARVEALNGFLGTEIGANMLVAYRRAANIVAIEERRNRRKYDGEVDSELLRQPEEQRLFERLALFSRYAETHLSRDVFEPAITQLSRLRQPVDEFFDKVTVNTTEPELRENRLRLLSRIRDTMNEVADFSQIEG